MAKLIIVSALMLAIGVMTGSATAEDEKLFAGCAPMDLLIAVLDPEDTQETGLTREAIINAAEARLRSARLFVPLTKQIENQQTMDREQILGINVHIVRTWGAPKSGGTQATHGSDLAVLPQTPSVLGTTARLAFAHTDPQLPPTFWCFPTSSFST